MSVEQKLAFVLKALELGGVIDISFHRFDDKGSAEKVAVELSEMVNIPYKEISRESSHWFKIKNYDDGLNVAIFFEEKEEEAKV
ncbi:hypothetical protein ACT8ZR_09070 [Neobacillus sp. M.A.Huq-85]